MVPRRAAQFLGERLARKLVPIGVLFVAGALLAALGFAWWPLSLVGGVLALASHRLSTGRLDFESDLKGWRGEKGVASVLNALPGEFRVLHDVEKRWGNIDHVVVGPTGVLAIETKNWSGAFSAKGGRLLHQGYSQDRLLREAVRGAMDVRRRLRSIDLQTWVSALIVSTRAPVQGSPLTLGPVTVTELSGLLSIATSGRTRLTPHEMARATAAILRDGQPIMSRAVTPE